ncbi:MAG: hypothetical protein C0619_10450 [Desulfuromonas sp.]|nr:MAG: hypothetical protein C0619_10450 [Desulfuromonas sp.]
MKKLVLIMAIALMFPMMASAEDNATAGAALELEGLTIAVSPGVFAYYNDGGVADPQWYLIATVHQGGTNFYATAQNSTSIFKQDATAPVLIGDLTGADYPTETEAASEDYWSDSAWTR